MKKKRELESISEILASVQTRPELREALEMARLVEAWADIVGPELAERGKLHSIQDKRLKIEAENSVWAHRLLYQKRQIRLRINNLVGRKLVKEVFVVLQGEEQPVEEAPSNREAGGAGEQDL